MPWSAVTVEAQRLELCRLAVSGSDVSFVELCRRFGVSPKTGYKWLGRYLAEGRDGLADRSRAPKSSPSRTSAEMESVVCALREKHRAWGGRKIRRRLMDLGYPDVPAASTITDILRRGGMIEDAPSQAGGWTRFEAETANDLWQMDHKGWFMTATGQCNPFDILDDYSRYNLALDASADRQAATVKKVMVDTFHTYGMPLRILCDNGSPWGNAQPGFRWTSLSVWLLDLGITVVHSRPMHPQTMGKDERFHRTLKLEVISSRPEWASYTQVQQAFDQWRIVYNHQRPHDALNGSVPADRYQPSPRSMPEQIDPVDYPDSYQVRKVDETARISFQGSRYKIGRPFTGRHIGIIPTNHDGIFTIVYRHQPIHTLDLTQ